MLRSEPLVRRARMHARTFASVPRAPYDVLFCGTDAFARTALEHILARKELTRSVQVLTPPDVAHKWGGRRMRVAPVKELAADARLPILHVPQGGMDEFALPEALQSSEAPMLITVSFGHRIPTSLLSRFSSPSLTLNLHPSLLPELRGAAPIQWALAREYTTTGVSVQQLHAERFDVGKLLAQEPVAIPHDSTYASLAPILADAGAALLVDTMAHLPERSADAKVQDDACATRAPKLQAKYGVLHWDKWDAQRIGARIRGFGHQVRCCTNADSHHDDTCAEPRHVSAGRVHAARREAAVECIVRAPFVARRTRPSQALWRGCRAWYGGLFGRLASARRAVRDAGECTACLCAADAR